MEDRHDVEHMLAGLLEASHLATFEQLPALVAAHARHAGIDEVLIYLVDLQQNVLRLVTGHGTDAHQHPDGVAGEQDAEASATLPVDGTLGGRAYQEVRLLATREPEDLGAGDAEYWWVPLLDGTERLGVLRVRTAGQEGRSAVADRIRHLASLVALMLVSMRPSSDSYARLLRTRPMNVAAEMEWNLLPPLTFGSDRISIGAVLEPAYQIGGDAFDYAVTGESVHLAIFDAMGHDVAAGLAANLAMAACRNQRRQGSPLAETSDAIEQILLQEFGPDTRFITAVIASLDTGTGILSWINRGHPPPVVIRGGRWTTALPCPPAHPMGMDMGVPPTLCTEQLEPGDLLLLYTDGITEAKDRHGREFGLQRFVDFVVRQLADGRPIPETLRRLIHTLMAHHAESLRDDATVLLVKWHGPAPNPSPGQ